VRQHQAPVPGKLSRGVVLDGLKPPLLITMLPVEQVTVWVVVALRPQLAALELIDGGNPALTSERGAGDDPLRACGPPCVLLRTYKAG
jgi:hypothetical protein